MLTWRFRPTPDGRVPQDVSIGVRDAVRRMLGKQLVLSLKEYRNTRSNRQNAYYWGVLVSRITDVMREAGNDMDSEDVHSYLKREIGKLNRVAVLPSGEVIKIPGSTARLNTKEFEDYTEKIRAWSASVLGIILPLPNEELS